MYALGQLIRESVCEDEIETTARSWASPKWRALEIRPSGTVALLCRQPKEGRGLCGFRFQGDIDMRLPGSLSNGRGEVGEEAGLL